MLHESHIMDTACVSARPSYAFFSSSLELLRKRALLLTLASLLVIALGLRLYGINWDDDVDFSLHPDERSIVWTAQQLSPDSLKNPPELFDVDSSTLVPRPPNHASGHGVYDYGSLPFYLLEFGAWIIGLFPGVDKTDQYTMTLIGRAFSAILDTGSVFLVFLLGRSLFGPRVGLLAAAFTTFAVLHIQLSHFYTTEAMLTFFSLLSLLFLIRVAREARKRDAALAGLAFGLALASKFSAAPMLVGVAAAPALYALKAEDNRIAAWAWDRERARRALKALGIILGAIALAFVVAQPYAVLDFKYYAADVYSQSEMVRRVIDFPYTRQYDNSLPFLYHIWQFTLWGVGLPLGVLMWAGMAFATAIALVRRGKADLLLVAWVLPFFLITGLAEVKFLRYLLPITPLLAIMASRMSLSGLSWLKGRRWVRPSFCYKAGTLGLALVLLATVFYAFAFVNVYTETHPATQVSAYVRSNLPEGTVLAVEHWDESLPGLYSYPRVYMQLYDPDQEPFLYEDHAGREVVGTKVDHLVDRLAYADYLVLFSNRLYGTIPRLRERYPISSRYYQLLFDGALGFEVEYVGQAYPNFLGVSFVNNQFGRAHLTPPQALASIQPTAVSLHLGHADDSFANYEHPMTILFKKVRPLSENELRAILEGTASSGSRGGILAAPLTDGGQGAVMSGEEARRQQEGGTFSRLFHRGDFANRVPWLAWFGMAQLIALAALPAGLLLFRHLPDRGYLLIKVLALLLAAYLTWLLASLHWLPFSRGTLWLSILAVGILSLAALVRAKDEILSFLRQRWRLVLLCEALFLVAFLTFYGIRAWNPDLWHPARGGEKPMDFAYLNAVTRSTEMPAYDPWFSGGYLNYYYFGQFQVASLIKLTGILPSVAYNLAIPLLFALTVGAAFSVVYNLAVAFGRSEERAPPKNTISPVWAGLAAALFVAVLGNLDGLVQVAQQGWRVTVQGDAFQGFDFWRSSRMIDTSSPDAPLSCGGCEITEFPFFSFLFADLHAHLIALPFAILAIGLGANLLLGASRASPRWLRLASLGLLALTVGALSTINSWDYPTYMVLAVALVLMAAYLRRRRLSLRTLATGTTGVVAVVVLSLLFFLPFHLNYQGSVEFPWLKRTEFTTPLYQYLGIHGIFLFIVLSYLLHRLHQTYRIFDWKRSNFRSLAAGRTGRMLYLQDANTLKSLYPFASIGLIIAIAALGFHTIAFLTLILLMMLPLAFRALTSNEAAYTTELFAFSLLALSLVLGIGVDLFRVNLVDPGRMNTVFKLYFHAWVLMALASAYFLWRLGFGRFLTGHLRSQRLWIAALAVLLISGMIYPVAATPDRSRIRFNPDPTTLDGMAYMKQAVYFDDADNSGAYDPDEVLELGWDYDAILWLQDNIQGSPVILEGNTELYRWGNRVSIYTGLPTVVGWDWHQQQQRWDSRAEVFVRRADVQTLYTTASIPGTLALLDKYQVKYIYVGQMERLYYPEEGLEKFQQMKDQGLLELVYPQAPSLNPHVLIYQVVE